MINTWYNTIRIDVNTKSMLNSIKDFLHLNNIEIRPINGFMLHDSHSSQFLLHVDNVYYDIFPDSMLKEDLRFFNFGNICLDIRNTRIIFEVRDPSFSFIDYCPGNSYINYNYPKSTRAIGIIAIDKDMNIGRKNDLLFHNKEDLQFFKLMTYHHPIIMGHNTFKSMNSTPLRNRINIVIGRNKPSFNNTTALESLNYSRNINKPIFFDAIDYFRNSVLYNLYPIPFIIGGKSIYENLQDQIDVWYITVYDTIVKDADTKVDINFKAMINGDIIYDRYHNHFQYKTEIVDKSMIYTNPSIKEEITYSRYKCTLMH